MIRLDPQKTILCYLDFDGVLHPDGAYTAHNKPIHLRGYEGHSLFEHDEILVDLLAPYPEVEIVLSTSWVREKGFTYAKGRLSPALQNLVIGATYHRREMAYDSFVNSSRGMQVYGDVHRRGAIHWFALDDDAFGWPAFCRDNLIHQVGGWNDAPGEQPPGLFGLGRPESQKAVAGRLKELVHKIRHPDQVAGQEISTTSSRPKP